MQTTKTTQTTRQARLDAITARNHEEALEAYVGTIAEIHETLRALQTDANDHFGTNPDAIHWGHVGDANRILAGLRETLAIARNENR